MSARISKSRLVAVSTTAIFGLVLAGAVTLDQVRDERPDVYVTFADASPLIEGNDVKAGGVKVGTVGSIEVEDGAARVGLVLDDEVLPLHTDATARVRPVGLLGVLTTDVRYGGSAGP